MFENCDGLFSCNENGGDNETLLLFVVGLVILAAFLIICLFCLVLNLRTRLDDVTTITTTATTSTSTSRYDETDSSSRHYLVLPKFSKEFERKPKSIFPTTSISMHDPMFPTLVSRMGEYRRRQEAWPYQQQVRRSPVQTRTAMRNQPGRSRPDPRRPQAPSPQRRVQVRPRVRPQIRRSVAAERSRKRELLNKQQEEEKMRRKKEEEEEAASNRQRVEVSKTEEKKKRSPAKRHRHRYQRPAESPAWRPRRVQRVETDEWLTGTTYDRDKRKRISKPKQWPYSSYSRYSQPNFFL